MSRPRLEVSGVQLIATVLAAVTGALLASFLGVVGTIAGTAIASAASTLGTAIYRHYLGRTKDRIRDVAPVIVRQWRPPESRAATRMSDRVEVVDVPVDHSGHRRIWPRYGLPALAAFVLVLGCITGFELVSGKPISSEVWGKSGSGTSIGSLFSSGHAASTPDPSSSAHPASSGASPSPAQRASSSPAPEASHAASPAG